MNPIFEHDCSKCVFCGNWKGRDVYSHISDLGVTIIFRYGNDGVDNYSYPINQLLGIE